MCLQQLGPGLCLLMVRLKVSLLGVGVSPGLLTRRTSLLTLRLSSRLSSKLCRGLSSCLIIICGALSVAVAGQAHQLCQDAVGASESMVQGLEGGQARKVPAHSGFDHG